MVGQGPHRDPVLLFGFVILFYFSLLEELKSIAYVLVLGHCSPRVMTNWKNKKSMQRPRQTRIW